MAIQEMLKKKRDEIKSQKSDVENSLLLIGIVLGVILVPLIAILPMASPWGRSLGLMETGHGTTIGITVMVISVLVGLILPFLVVPRWLTTWWDYNERRAWSWLRHTDLPLRIAQEGQWEAVFAVLDANPWMKLSGTRRPRTLDEQIELASDYSWAQVMLIRGQQRRLFWAVWWGSATRLADDIAVWIFGSCGTFGCLMFGGMLLFLVGLPLWVPWIMLYIKRQAWQSAILTHFMDGRPQGLGKIRPPVGIKK
ncbi:hypothetical protein JW859_08185 [bacterium]|nr:hypothetical protein [bacterium]